MSFIDWQNSIVGHQFDGDHDGSFDCVDVPESWVMYLWPSNPESLELGWGNAKDIYANSNANFFQKINYSAGAVPLQGDIIVFGATPTNPYGHIAVVISATPTSVTVVQENSYTQQAAYIGTLGYSYCLGFLRPLINIQGVIMPTAQDVKDYVLAWTGVAATDQQITDYTQASWRVLTDDILKFVVAKYQADITDLQNKPPSAVPEPIAPLPNLVNNVPAPTDTPVPTPADQEKVNIFVALWKALFG